MPRFGLRRFGEGRQESVGRREADWGDGRPFWSSSGPLGSVSSLVDKDSAVELNAGDDHSKPETKQSRPGEASAEPVQWSLQPQLVRAKRAQLTETWGKSFSYSLLRGRETPSTPYCT